MHGNVRLFIEIEFIQEQKTSSPQLLVNKCQIMKKKRNALYIA